MIDTAIGARSRIRFDILIILVFAVLCSVRAWLIRDGIWDDNAWLLSIYATEGLREFLDTGFAEVRRIPLGIFLYALLQLHRASEYFYVAWHLIDTITQIGSPILLYLILRKQFPENRLFAFSAAVCFVVFPLDYTIGYASGTSYRLGLLLSLVSFYATQHAFTGVRWRPLPLAIAVITCISSYMLIESAIALEPARAFIIGHQLHQIGFRRRELLKHLVHRCVPFALMGLLLVIYKLTFRPYGIYEGMYNFDPLFLFRGRDIAKLALHLLFVSWLMILRFFDAVAITSILFGLLGAILFFKLPDNATSELAPESSQEQQVGRAALTAIISLGLIFLIPPILIAHAFSRPILWGMNSSHAIPTQIGYATLLGFLIYRAHISTLVRRRFWPKTALAGFIGMGVFFCNANIDMFLGSWRHQMEFWKAFTERFQSLPEKADFMLDVHSDTLYPDLYNYYDFEFQLNLLYATSDNPRLFRKYRVYSRSEMEAAIKMNRLDPSYSSIISRKTHLGEDALKPNELIVVHYRNNEILVNREILAKYPGVVYQGWLKKNPPQFPAAAVPYPLRNRLLVPGNAIPKIMPPNINQ